MWSFLRENLKILYLEVEETNRIDSREKKNLCKNCTTMPCRPIGQEFLPEYGVGIFATKLVDTIFTAPRNSCKIVSKQ